MSEGTKKTTGFEWFLNIQEGMFDKLIIQSSVSSPHIQEYLPQMSISAIQDKKHMESFKQTQRKTIKSISKQAN